MRQGAASTVRFHSSVVIGPQEIRENPSARSSRGAKRAKLLFRECCSAGLDPQTQ